MCTSTRMPRIPLHVVVDIISLLPDGHQYERRPSPRTGPLPASWCGSWGWRQNEKVDFRRLCYDVAYGSSSRQFLSGLTMYLCKQHFDSVPDFWRENIKFIYDVTIDTHSMYETVRHIGILEGIHTVRITGGTDFDSRHMKVISDTFCKVGSQTHKLVLHDLDNVESDLFKSFAPCNDRYIHTLRLSQFHDVISLNGLNNLVYTLRVSECSVEVEGDDLDDLRLSGISKLTTKSVHEVSFFDCEPFPVDGWEE